MNDRMLSIQPDLNFSVILAPSFNHPYYTYFLHWILTIYTEFTLGVLSKSYYVRYSYSSRLILVKEPFVVDKIRYWIFFLMCFIEYTCRSGTVLSNTLRNSINFGKSISYLSLDKYCFAVKCCWETNGKSQRCERQTSIQEILVPP